MIFLSGLFILIVAVVCGLAYRKTPFQYSIGEGQLKIRCLHLGFIPVPKTIPFNIMDTIEPLQHWWELLPIVSGGLPAIWGQIRPSRMLIIKRKGPLRMLLIIVSPKDPVGFRQAVEAHLVASKLDT
jgi:hypothetical protein